MPRDGDYGCSEWTQLKTDHHADILAMHMGIVRAVQARNPWADQTYRYFDLTAGPGRHPETGAPQAPLRLVEIAGALAVDWRAVLFERCPETWARLVGEMAGQPRARCVLADSRQALADVVAQELPRPRPSYYGLVYFDPVPGVEMFDVIGALGQVFRLPQLGRVDVLLYVSATTIKRLRECCDQTLRACLDALGKRKWFARDTFGSRHQWTFLLGTNWPDMQEYKRIRLFDVDREPGVTLFDKLDLTDAQRKEKAGGVLPFCP